MNTIKKFELVNDILAISLKGEINSSNSTIVEQEVVDVIKNNQFKTLMLDFLDITYVSSAGLRVILRLKQTYKDVHIINASLEVYDVLSMTGFVNIMDIKKALNKIDVTGKEIIGEGFFSIVYRIDPDTIVKAYKQDTDIKEVERELNMAKEAFILGIPTAISFDVVQVGTKLGVRFEMLNSTLLRDLFRNDPDNFNEYADKYAVLLKKINTTETDDETLPSTKQLWFDKCKAAEPYLTKEEYQKIYQMVDSIPERKTFVHGDCHIKNIMVQDNELFLIDMDTLSRGHPIFELAALVAPYVLFEEDDPGNNLAFFGIDSNLSQKIYNETINRYFGKDDKDIKGKIRLLGYLHMVWWTLTYQKDNLLRLNNCRDRLRNLLKIYDDVNVGL